MVITVAPDGATAILRDDSVVSLGPAFAWSPSVQARTLSLINGQTLLVLDTAANYRAVNQALNPDGASVQPGEMITPEAGEANGE